MRDLGAAHGILGYFARHRTAANLLLMVMLVAGLAALPKMRAQFFPDVVVDSVTVSVAWDSAGAEALDRAVVGVLEPALLAVEGVESSEAVSTGNDARIEIEFEPGWDMGRAATEVQTAIDAVTDLPDAAEEPEIQRGRWSDQVTDVVITGPIAADQLGRLADEFTARLFRAGVTRTTIRGVAAPRTIVEVTSLSLARHDVSMAEIADAIGAETDARPAGDMGAAGRVSAGGESRTPDEIARIVLRSGPDGSALRVGDVGRIVVEGANSERAYFVGDDPAVSVRVDRSDRGDAIELQARVEAVAGEMALSVPEGVRIDLVNARADWISGRLDILLDNGLIGLGLVVALLFLFLNARTAFWVAAGIPVAMIAAIALMYLAGLTFNMISLFALIITLGIVVDDAIVVGEHADFRARRLGEAPVVAAENAARRMFAPVFSATLTTVIAFLGLVAVGGRFGALIADIPFTVIVVLIASLAECFLVLPNHMAHALAHTARRHWYDAPSRVVNRGFTWARERAFRPLMRVVVRARYPVLAATILVLASQAALFIRGDVQWRFFNAPERGSVTGNFAMSAGATRAETIEQLRLLQGAVRDVAASYEAEHGRNPVTHALGEIGGSAGRGLSGVENSDADLLGGISVELIAADLRPYSSFDVVARLQEDVPRHPNLEQISFRGWRSGPGGDAIEVRIFGAGTETLKEAAEALKSELAQFGEVSALEDTLAYDKRELVLELTPQGKALGVTIDALGRVLRDRLSGVEAASFPEGTRSATIRVELPEAEKTADFLDRMVVPTKAGDQVRLADLVTVATREGFSTIRRENGIRQVGVTGDLDEDDPARAAEIMRGLENDILPALEEDFGVSTTLAGLSEQEGAFLSDAALGLALCLAGIYLALAWIFASWTRPVVVMAIIPFGLVGTIWGHYLWDVPLSMFSVVGMIGMTGIIINDSIVLVTTVDEYAEGRSMGSAIVDAACDRLRPVLLTTLTTVLGLTPLLYETSAQAQFLKPTVITLVYGLGFGMVLVLLVVPALLAMQQDAGRQIRALRRSLRSRARRQGAGIWVGAAAGGIALLFAATLGAVLVAGRMAGPLAALADESGQAPAAFALFAAGTLMVVVLVGIAAAIRSRAGQRAAQSQP